MTTDTPTQADRLLRLDEAAEALQVSDSTIRRLVRDKELKVVRIGRAVRVRPEDLEAFIRDRLATEE
jgi:excisionase family DNA binding protein